MPADDDLQEALARVGSRHIELDAAQRTIRFRVHGMELNLGAIGKGYALDRAAELMAGEGVGDFLIHGGQSSVLARGANADSAPGRPGWVVAVLDPLRPARRLAEVRLTDRLNVFGLIQPGFTWQWNDQYDDTDPFFRFWAGIEYTL